MVTRIAYRRTSPPLKLSGGFGRHTVSNPQLKEGTKEKAIRHPAVLDRSAAVTVLDQSVRETHRALFDRQIVPLIEPAYRLAFAMLRQREAAEDAVQDATLNAWRKMKDFRGERGGLRAWYFTIVANQCRSVRRGRWWSVLRFPDIRPREESREALSNASELRQSIDRLSHSDRVLLYLYYWLDLPLDEIAAAAGISPAAAKSRLYRAVGRLRLELDPEEERL
jgi:RNA polymerase sigma-70 factor (ECF subfamily)